MAEMEFKDLKHTAEEIDEAITSGENHISNANIHVTAFEKSKIANFENYDDTEIKNTIEKNKTETDTKIEVITTFVNGVNSNLGSQINTVSGDLSDLTSAEQSLEKTVADHKTSIDNNYKMIQDAFHDITTSTQNVYHELDNLKVDKQTGYGLSANDFTTAYKSKIDGISEGAEVNVQSDWAETSTGSDAFIKGKPNVISCTTAGVSNVYFKVASISIATYQSSGMTIMLQQLFNGSVTGGAFFYDIAIRVNNAVTNRTVYNRIIMNPYGTTYHNRGRDGLVFVEIVDSTVNVYVKSLPNSSAINYITIINPFSNKSRWNFYTTNAEYIETLPETSAIFNPTDVTAAKYDTEGNVISDIAGQSALNKSTLGFQRKNMLNLTASGKTQNGLTFTVNDDKTVTVSGTATANTNFTFNFTLPQGSYAFTGCVEGGSTSTYSMPYYNTKTWGVYGTDTGSGFKVTIPEERTIQGRILIYSGVTVDNLVFKPMVRYAEITDDTYEPYADDIYTYVTALEKRIAALESK